jgi:tetrahydromethanopterin S-methyltransferase subunit B
MATREQLIEDFADHKYATGEKFARLINSMKVVQEPVEDPAASGTSLSFIDSIEQDKDGKITATKKTLDLANVHELSPFKGWYKTGDTLPTDGFDGAYLYFKDTAQTPAVTTIYRWNGTTYADTGTEVDESNVQTFATGQAVNEVGIDDEPTAGSTNLVESGGVQNELALGAVYDVSAKNPTSGPNSDGKWESLSALLSDANLNNIIPASVRRGGMSIKFMQSSDNKYVQCRYMSSSTATADFTNVANWQGVDEKPIAGSHNLLESDGVNAELNEIVLKIDGECTLPLKLSTGYVQINTGKILASPGASCFSQPFLLKAGQTIAVSTANSNTSFINSTTLESVAVGSTVTTLANVTVGEYTTKTYTATEDTMIVVSVSAADYEVKIYDSNSLQEQINELDGKVDDLEERVDEVDEKLAQIDYINPQLDLSTGYVQKNTGKILTSPGASRFSQPFLLKAGQTIEVSTANINTSFINSTTSESVSVGNTVTPLANVETSSYTTKKYTAEEDTMIVVSISVTEYEVKIYDSNSLRKQVDDLEERVDELDTREDSSKLFSDKTYVKSYNGERINLFDDNTIHYTRKQFSTIPLDSSRFQSFAINGEYIVFLFHQTMTGELYRLSDNSKICDLIFQTDSVYGGSHNNACGFGIEKYDENSIFPLFYISQFDVGKRGYLAYDLVSNNDGTFTPKLVQIIYPSDELKQSSSFGLGPGDYCIDTNNSFLYSIRYLQNQIGGDAIVSKFTMPTKSQGDDYVSSTGNTIKVVMLDTSDILDSFNIGSSLLQDNCYYKGHIIKTGSELSLINLTEKTKRNVPINVGVGFAESEGIDVYMGKLLINYWGKQGLYELIF